MRNGDRSMICPRFVSRDPLCFATFKADFLNITTSEKKNGFLLIEIFRKLVNPQNYGHQGSILGGLSYMSGSVRILRFGESGTFKAMREEL
jgi:hypothetical protein